MGTDVIPLPSLPLLLVYSNVILLYYYVYKHFFPTRQNICLDFELVTLCWKDQGTQSSTNHLDEYLTFGISQGDISFSDDNNFISCQF